MKILITGASGLLGQYLNLEFSNNYQIMSLYNSNIGNCNKLNSVKLDLNDFDKCRELLKDFSPDVVIHTAAVSSPITAQKLSSKVVYNTNVNVSKNIAEICKSIKSKLIYTSTDLVYAGYRGSMLNEDAKLMPISIYAETKLMGEQVIKNTAENFIILRLALLYGFGLNHSKNHFQQMYEQLRNKLSVKLFVDQFRTPLSLFEAARMIEKIVKADITNETINLGGVERVSRYELGERLCDIANLDKSLLEKITMNAIPEIPKVQDVSLNTDKLKLLGIKQKSIEESIKEILELK